MLKISFESLRGLAPRQGGLTQSEISSQTSRHGANNIVEVTGNPWFDLVLDTAKDPMIWFLLGIGAVFLSLGEKGEALVLFAAMMPLMAMDAILHWRTRASTAGLKSQLTATVTVVRGEGPVVVDSRQLVPGDLVVVRSGTFLPADGVFRSLAGLQVDESALTGEALPITKEPALFDPFALAASGEVSVSPTALGFAGTRVLTGSGELRVTHTGKHTSYGAIVQSVALMPQERTPLQRAITSLVQVLIAVAAVFCLLLAAVRVYQGHGWIDALVSAATLAVAAIPEEFPVVFTFYLGVGVYRLARKKALVRRAVSVENIGRVTHICTDKTGTITLGILRLTHIDPVRPGDDLTVLRIALAASNPDGDDPADLAIKEAAASRLLVAQERFMVFPFTEERKQETAMIRDGANNLACMKGAPETVLAKSQLAAAQKSEWLNTTSQWALSGHRVLACARRLMTPAEVALKAEPQDDFEFCGLVVFEDPARPEVAAAIAQCQEDGIKVMMLTGDHPDTALAIARDVGLGGKAPVVVCTAPDHSLFSEPFLAKNPQYLSGIDVVARSTPLEKLNIVRALQKFGGIVAVTGDGVNDVPALKAADIGVAMGLRGTRSAKEVSSIVLADDNFCTIVNAIMEGRQLLANLRSSFQYLLLVHIPLVLTAALIPLCGYPLLYLPVHIVWLELVIHPSALFAFQGKAGKMGPRPAPHSRFFGRKQTVAIFVGGVLMTLAISAVFLVALRRAGEIRDARSMALVMLNVWSAGIVALGTGLRSTASVLVVVGTLGAAVGLTQIEALAMPLHLAAVMPADWLVLAGITAACLAVFLQVGRSTR